MTNVMSTGLGRKWWFNGLLGGLSALLTLPLLRAAGLASPDNLAQWVVYFLCFFSVWRALAFAGWLLLLLVSPSSKLLEPTGR
jgi:hypothetical protein